MFCPVFPVGSRRWSHICSLCADNVRETVARTGWFIVNYTGYSSSLGKCYNDRLGFLRRLLLTLGLTGMDIRAFAYMRSAKEGRACWNVGGLFMILAEAKDTGGAYSIMEQLTPKGRRL